MPDDAPIRLGIQRHTGPLGSMGVGRWLSELTPHRPGRRVLVWFACPDCGSVTDIDPDDVAANGDVRDEFFCQEVRCDFARLLTLSGWGEPVFDTSDVKP